MYPSVALARLASRKVALQQGIAAQRESCLAAATRVVQPLQWLERARSTARRFSKLQATLAWPLGLLCFAP